LLCPDDFRYTREPVHFCTGSWDIQLRFRLDVPYIPYNVP
jgi:hypothetical protein